VVPPTTDAPAAVEDGTPAPVQSTSDNGRSGMDGLRGGGNDSSAAVGLGLSVSVVVGVSGLLM